MATCSALSSTCTAGLAARGSRAALGSSGRRAQRTLSKSGFVTSSARRNSVYVSAVAEVDESSFEAEVLSVRVSLTQRHTQRMI